ncbi:MAG: 30S ribosomal protein S7 [Planctomycetes bacterium]|nr:30S ribosomal protein S7 [Planctomycetota bacterium]
MARKHFTASVKQFRGDPRHNNRLASKFINNLMRDGKKSVAQRVFYEALDQISKKIKDTPAIDVFTAALENVKPAVEVRSRRVGGANYQVPIQVSSKRRQSLAIRWVLAAVRSKSGRPMARRLADELMAAFRNEGTAMTTRDNVHRMADANKAFAHFAWGR